jgi:DNA-binding MarR family transcriptional regulator
MQSEELDKLPPTQYLVLEVLGARYRLGETMWTFPTSCTKAVAELEKLGLVTSMHGVTEHTFRVSLTEIAIGAMLSGTYLPPAFERERKAAFRDAAEIMHAMIFAPNGSATRSDLLTAVQRLAR